MRTAPGPTPNAPSWMWAIVNTVFAGKLLTLAMKVTFAVVMLPAESFVTSNVIVALPVPVDSALVIGGVSLAGSSVAVKVGLVGEVGEVDELLPQPAANSARTAARADRRFIGRLLLIRKTCERG